MPLVTAGETLPELICPEAESTRRHGDEQSAQAPDCPLFFLWRGGAVEKGDVGARSLPTSDFGSSAHNNGECYSSQSNSILSPEERTYRVAVGVSAAPSSADTAVTEPASHFFSSRTLGVFLM